MRSVFGRRACRVAPLLLLPALSGLLFAQSGPAKVAEAVVQETGRSIGPGEAAAQLAELVGQLNDLSSLYRLRALEAIETSPAFDAEAVVRILRERVDDKDPLVAQEAVHGLLLRGEEQLPLLREVDLSDTPGETAELVEVQVAALNQDSSALRELMRNGDATVQEAAFGELAANDAAGAIDALRAEFEDRASLHRVQTLELLARSPYTSAATVVTPLLQAGVADADPLVHETAQKLLTERTTR